MRPAAEPRRRRTSTCLPVCLLWHKSQGGGAGQEVVGIHCFSSRVVVHGTFRMMAAAEEICDGATDLLGT